MSDNLGLRKNSVCTFCRENDTAFFRPYSGEALCRSCFIESIEKKVRRTFSKYSMLKSNDRIAVALSGGKDSSALLFILNKMEKDFPKSSIFAITVDEGICGYREESLKNAEKICAELGVEHLLVSFEKLYGFTLDRIAEKARDSKEGLTPCSYCGVLRRRALNKAARELKATKLATAHTLDDEAQTILLNFIHGDVLRASMIGPSIESSKFVHRIKPLCELPEDEVALYSYFRGIKFQSAVCPYAPFALRSEIREFLNSLEARHPGTKHVLYHSYEKIKPLLKAGLKVGMTECSLCSEPSGKSICEPCKMIGKIKLSL